MSQNKSAMKMSKKQRFKQTKIERKEQILEQRRSLMREHLQRELIYGIYAQKKHEANWRRMLTQITLPYHKEQLEYTWQTFERVMDAKEFIISRLMDEIQQQQDQYMISIEMHITGVDQIVSAFHGQLQVVHDNFISRLNFLKKQHHELLDDMNLNNEENMNNLKSMSYGLEIQEKERERSLRADLCSKVEYEADDKHGLTLELKERLTLSFEDVLRTTHAIIDKFLKKTRKRRHDYDALKTAEDKAQDLLAHGIKRIQHLNDVIRKLKKKEEDIGHNELANLEGERKFFKRACLLLKQKLVVDIKLDKARIEFFIGVFQEAYDEMNKFLKRQENMINLLRCTKKLETLEEKVRPYPVSRNAAESMKNREYFLFWQRVGKVDFSRTALMEEKSSLQIENMLLRKKIDEICSCLSCPRLTPICHREGPIPFTDGVTVMKKYEIWREIKRR